MDLEQLALDNMQLNGSLPFSWGASGNWPNMTLLDLQANFFSGELCMSAVAVSHLSDTLCSQRSCMFTNFAIVLHLASLVHS